MRTRSVTGHRVLAIGLAGTVLLAACGGDSGPGDAGAGASANAGATLPQVDGEPSRATPAVGAGIVDLVGADVVAASDIATNQLPSVVVDDLTSGRKVNFRNLVPQDKPILLWMYAPH